MTRHCVTDEQYGILTRRLDELKRRVDEGSVPYLSTLDKVQKLMENKPITYSHLHDEWQEFYRKYFRISVDLSEVAIPEKQGDFSRVIMIPKGLTINQAFNACKKAFPSWSYYNDLDQDVTVNGRNTKASCAIRVRDRLEADEELCNLSANDLDTQGINTITLLERLVYEMKYFSETGEHLDVKSWTICASSRNRNGDVLLVRWIADDLNVHGYNPYNSGGDLRARAVIS